MLKVRRALVSVSDKRNLEDFVKGLNGFGVEMLSTGGTAKMISKLGIPVRMVSDYTGFPEMLDGRVKTLHPKIHGGLLSLREKPEHMRQVKEHGIELIDMVVVNLYPFEKAIKKEGIKLEEVIENIDIGGPSMLRSAAKNYRSVAVICNPDRYADILKELKENKGCIGEETLDGLAVEVFEHTAHYDAVISRYLRGKLSKEKNAFPQVLTMTFEKAQDLRYGENPHQKAAFYKDAGIDEPGVSGARQLHGKELSFNNILDLSAAFEIVREFEKPAVSVMKHNNPCGAACGDSVKDVFKAALDTDRLSAFGSVIGINRNVDAETAKTILGEADFVECIIAPSYDPDALEALKTKKNLRILEVPGSDGKFENPDIDAKKVVGGLLIQDKDRRPISEADLKVVTKKKPTKEQIESLLFGWKIAKHVKSNSIVLTKGARTVGIGAGQMSRVDSVIIASRKAGELAKGSCLASDAFFPKPDGIEMAKRSGVEAIIQPGGSVKDEDVIKAADEAGIAMVFTGARHFRH
ncbi:MAG: bifunctional phosphoribosylaminoimidazolecarboxamide formyltransferase/IMP cyclohydrolase [Candidatus Omnitrophota bacterium]